MPVKKSTIFSISFALLWYIVLTIPFLWIVIVPADSFSLKPIHLAFFLLIILFFIKPVLFTEAVNMFKSVRLIWVAYIACLVIPLLSLGYNTGDEGEIFRYTFKQVVYCAYAFMAGTLLSHLIKRYGLNSCLDTLSLASFASLVLLIGIAFYARSSEGGSLGKEYMLALSSGNSLMMRYGIYQKLFNYQIFDNITAVNDQEDVLFRANLVNIISGAFILFIIVSVLYLKVQGNIPRLRKWLIYLTVSVSTFLCITSFSRSNIISLGLTALLVFVLSVRMNKTKSIVTTGNVLVLLISLLVFIPITFFVFADVIEPLFQTVTGRLTSLSENARIDQFDKTLVLINENFLLGQGGGTKVSVSLGNQSKDLSVHNFILSYWLQYGLLGLITTIYFNLVIIYYVWKTINISIKKPLYWNLAVPLPWVVALAVLPVFRMQIEDGGISIIEWFSLALLFSLLSVNNQYYSAKHISRVTHL